MATLNFKGKGIIQNHHLAVPFHELVPDQKKGLSAKPRLDDNLIIHGDNLLALKALLPTYAGKVKCIYIDPPYNTGNEGWAYNDNVNNPMMKDWLGKTVDTEDLTRHDKWLCMMMPRLKLLRELLADDGAIFVSIDDNEQHRLRMLMDEVFGEENLLANFIWKSRQIIDSRTQNRVSIDHEYVLAYGRTKDVHVRGEDIDISKYSNPDKDPRGPWMSNNMLGLATKSSRPNLHYVIVDPKTKLKYQPSPESGWRYSQDTMRKKIDEGRIIFPKEAAGRPREKLFVNERQNEFTGFSSVFGTEVGYTLNGTKELREILDGNYFQFPKPHLLIKALINQVAGKTDIVLDSFAGSGSTAHAVAELNLEDGGKRQYILVQIPEKLKEDSEAFVAGFKNVIEITLERVRRVIKGVKGAKDENLKKGFGGTFSYFELGKAMDEESMLSGKSLPTYEAMARYIFHVATGAAFDAKKLDKKRGFIGESGEYEVYLIYEPDVAKLKELALTLPVAQSLGKPKTKKRLV
ncbi:MAG TPA: site-specific DNA-methyltransferase, partial [Candidatus Peribacteraceae bacterium]|nr:site-specific DNA-methyltransferase [Candidatus Peribacteraceae bacterium]